MGNIGLFILVSHCVVCRCEQITDGSIFVHDKPFMVYFIKSHQPENQNDPWLCGGCLVSASQVLTSAACLDDVSHVYVIAGYKYYIDHKYIDSNKCTRDQKRRVMKYSVPLEIKVLNDNSRVERGKRLDIAVATVDRPYYAVRSYLLSCHYIPKPISVNYDEFHRKEGTPVVKYGWGNIESLQKNAGSDNVGQFLRIVNTVVRPTSQCKNYFNNGGINSIIDKWMICTSGYSNSEYQYLATLDTLTIGDDDDSKKYATENFKYTLRSERTAKNSRRFPRTSLNGNSCQNFHGGPLVAWEGANEVVVGVGVTAIYDKSSSCENHSISVSTYCLGNILECLLTEDIIERRICTSTVTKDGYEIKENIVMWSDDNNQAIHHDAVEQPEETTRNRVKKSERSHYPSQPKSKIDAAISYVTEKDKYDEKPLNEVTQENLPDQGVHYVDKLLQKDSKIQTHFADADVHFSEILINQKSPGINTEMNAFKIIRESIEIPEPNSNEKKILNEAIQSNLKFFGINSDQDYGFQTEAEPIIPNKKDTRGQIKSKMSKNILPVSDFRYFELQTDKNYYIQIESKHVPAQSEVIQFKPDEYVDETQNEYSIPHDEEMLVVDRIPLMHRDTRKCDKTYHYEAEGITQNY